MLNSIQTILATSNAVAPSIPPLPSQPIQIDWLERKKIPPAPVVTVTKKNSEIYVTWDLQNFNAEQHADIMSYQIYAKEVTPGDSASTGTWTHIGTVKALRLPMVVTLNQLAAGKTYISLESSLNLFSS